jgi:hypothetical protein
MPELSNTVVVTSRRIGLRRAMTLAHNRRLLGAGVSQPWARVSASTVSVPAMSDSMSAASSGRANR